MTWDQRIDAIVPKIVAVELELSDIKISLMGINLHKFLKTDEDLLHRRRELIKYHKKLQKQLDVITIPPECIVNGRVVRTW